MRSTQILALGALTRFVAAQTCTRDIEISEATPSIDCEVVDADITVLDSVTGALVIDGPEKIKGNLLVSNVTGLLSISSNTISSIEGTFTLDNCEFLNSIQMDSLRSLKELKMSRLTQLRSLVFGTEGVTKASVVSVVDTNLDSLSGLKLATVDSININNNYRLTTFESDLVNITSEFIITSNGDDFNISMPLLESAAEIQIANTRSFQVPLLETVSKSLKLDQNPEMESFFAPNLTKVDGTVSFINNEVLANLSLPALTEIGGGLTIINNTELIDIDGFPKLEIVGDILLGGNFEKVEMPALEDVQGSANVSSTTDIEDFCKFFDDAESDGRIRGKSNCESENEEALEGDNSDSDSGSSGGDDSGEEESTDEGSAGLLGVNFVVLGLSLVAGVAQLL